MGKVFKSHTKFDPYPGQYSFENWNRAVVEYGDDPRTMQIIGSMVKDNLYVFMNVLLDFEAGESTYHPWVPKRERRYGAKRTK